jgi:SAM-dependent methyltransferase
MCDQTAESYDRMAEEYASRFFHELDHKPLDRALLNCFAEMLRGKGTVADIGCGPGHLARHLHDCGLETVGIDLSPGMVEMARRLNPGLIYKEGDMRALDAEEGSWAGIAAFYSIIHVRPGGIPCVLAEFHRVLQSEGLLLIAFHVGDECIHRDEWWGQSISLDFQFFRASALERQLEEAGFTVEVRIEREPNPEVEHPSRRGYFLARKSNDTVSTSQSFRQQSVARMKA